MEHSGLIPRTAPGTARHAQSGHLRHTRPAWLSEEPFAMRAGMRQAGIEPATSRSGGARSIP